MSRRVSLSLRAAAIVIVLGAPFAPTLPSADETTSLMLVIDRSESIEEASAELADAFVRDVDALAAETQVGVVEVDGEARVRRWPGEQDRERVHIPHGGTDLAAGIRLGAAALPASGRRRLVLLTDGRDTAGGARAAVERARAQNIEVSVLALETDGSVPRITELEAVQDRIGPGEPFMARAELSGPPGNAASVLWRRDGDYLTASVVTFDEHGHATLSFSDPAPATGPHVYEARLGAQRARLFVDVVGEPKVLLVTLTPGETPSLLMRALEGAGTVARHALSRGPVTAEELRDADLVVLSDLPLEQPGTASNVLSGLDLDTQRQLLTYVSEEGGGLLVSGGAFGFGPPWANQPITRLLPVTIEDQGELQDPPVAIAMMLDASGSMSVRVGGYTKIRLAVEGCLAAASTLRPEDRIAIAAVEDRTSWVHQLAPTQSLDARSVRRMRARGGGIYVYTGLRDAYTVLDEATEPIRHVLIFSDTQDSEEQHLGCIWPPCAVQGQSALELATLARGRGITTTVVGIGDAAGRHAGFLSDLAAAGGGRYYLTETGTDLRRIFVAETRAVSRSNLREEHTPLTVQVYPMLDGVDNIPALSGFVQARVRPTAHTPLLTSDGRPVLATWRHGVGTVVAFTSDLGGRWSRSWTEWDQAPQLLRQVVRHAMRRRSARADLEVRLSARGVEVTLDVAPGTDVSTHRLELIALDDTAQPTTLPATLERIGPDHYRAVARTDGRPIVVARLRDEEDRVVAESSAQDTSLSEHAGVGADRRALRELARLGGGEVLERAEQALSNDAVGRPRALPTWPYLLLLAALLVVLDLFARRLGKARRRVDIPGLVGPSVGPRPTANDEEPADLPRAA